MRGGCRGILILILLLLLQVAGLLLYLKGFLLTRVVLPDRSGGCLDSHCGAQLPKRQFKRVIWLLVDALRYDFAEYNETMAADSNYYSNKMTHVHHLLRARPRNVKLYRFVADPPTTTMQRLKALTTGSLPTFVDIGSNFNSYEIDEDSVIYQARQSGQKMSFMGDDTWLGLYPGMFDVSRPFPSLNVRDLHTVDNGVIEYIFPEIEKGDSAFVVGHFLGVDHCGHTFGPKHKFMTEKLVQMDNVLKDIFVAVGNDTIVFVFGDHGMTSSGDHGGETSLETDAALLIYSPIPLFHPDQPRGLEVFQTDIVPTTSLLLGASIPFSNLGMVIPEVFAPWHESDIEKVSFNNSGFPHSTHPSRVTLDLLKALSMNAKQMNTYLEKYVTYSNDFSHNILKDLREKFSTAESKYSKIRTETGTMAQELLLPVADAYIEYMRTLRLACSDVWAKFDDRFISGGIAVLCVHFLIVILLLFATIDFKSSAVVVRYLCHNWIDVVSLLLVLMHATVPFSNSFIVYEQHIVLYFQQSLVICLAVLCIKKRYKEEEELYRASLNRHSFSAYIWKWNVIRALLVLGKSILPYLSLMMCIKFVTAFHNCRSEQVNCQHSVYFQPIDFYSDSFYVLLGKLIRLVLAMSAFYAVASYFTNNFVFSHLLLADNRASAGSKRGFGWSCVWRGGLICLSQVLLGGYLDAVRVWWGRFLVFLDVWAIGTTISRPFDGYFKKIDLTLYKHQNLLVSLPSLLTTIFMLLILIVCTPNDALVIPLTLFLIQLMLVIHILQQLPQVSILTRGVFFSFFGYQYFFGLGHQAMVTTMRFTAGYLGIYGNVSGVTLIIAGVIVGINTLSAQVVASLSLPLAIAHINSSHRPFLSRLLVLQLVYLAAGSMRLICGAVAASIHRRHLMVWAVFGPRFMFEIAFQCVNGVMSLVVYIVMARYASIVSTAHSRALK